MQNITDISESLFLKLKNIPVRLSDLDLKNIWEWEIKKDNALQFKIKNLRIKIILIKSNEKILCTIKEFEDEVILMQSYKFAGDNVNKLANDLQAAIIDTIEYKASLAEYNAKIARRELALNNSKQLIMQRAENQIVHYTGKTDVYDGFSKGENIPILVINRRE